MGFDLHGIAPEINEQEAEILTKHSWANVPADVKKEYWAASDKHEKANPGIYFRNNNWWWRPLWTYVTTLCSDILSSKDIEKGGWNNNQTISKTKAVKIAKRILREATNGNLDKYAQDYKAMLAACKKEKCDHCKDASKTDKTCLYCKGTKERESWAKSYPFSVENAVDFANFARESGGFSIS